MSYSLDQIRDLHLFVMDVVMYMEQGVVILKVITPIFFLQKNKNYVNYLIEMRIHLIIKKIEVISNYMYRFDQALLIAVIIKQPVIRSHFEKVLEKSRASIADLKKYLPMGICF